MKRLDFVNPVNAAQQRLDQQEGMVAQVNGGTDNGHSGTGALAWCRRRIVAQVMVQQIPSKLVLRVRGGPERPWYSASEAVS